MIQSLRSNITYLNIELLAVTVPQTKIIFQQQQLIELIRESRLEDAIRFASEQLAERGEEDPVVLEELERTLALLAFEDPHQSPFSDLLSHSHRQKVRSM